MPMSSKEWIKYIAIVLIGFVFMNLIFLWPAFRQTNTVDPTSAGQLGDFVGGYVGTFFTLVSFVVLVWTLNQQKAASSQQAESSTLQSFENRYFELIQMHRHNVAELQVGISTGRKVFVDLIREFRCIHHFVRKVAESASISLDQTQLFHVSYYILVYGVGPNSSRMLESSLSIFGNEFVQLLDNTLRQEATKWRIFFRAPEVEGPSLKEKPDSWELSWVFSYVPFEGHLSRLGHYYRHLYQCVAFVDSRSHIMDKFDYVRMIRAQLSTHEQALLLINSLSPVGYQWISKGFIKEYGLVHNIPRDFFHREREIMIDEMFGEQYFEWQENQCS